jgi:hypothetical protein
MYFYLSVCCIQTVIKEYSMQFDLPFIYVAVLVCGVKRRTEIEGV